MPLSNFFKVGEIQEPRDIFQFNQFWYNVGSAKFNFSAAFKASSHNGLYELMIIRL